MMYPRLELLRELLMEAGSIWVAADDNEGARFSSKAISGMARCIRRES